MATRHVQVAYYGDQFARLVDQHKDDALFAMGQVVLDEATQRAPRGPTGNLQRSGYLATRRRSTFVARRFWRKQQRPPDGCVTVAFSAPHAHLVEGGRHASGQIRPRSKRGPGAALKFRGVFRARASFRGVAARPFLGPAIEATKETMVHRAAQVLRNALEGGMSKGRP